MLGVRYSGKATKQMERIVRADKRTAARIIKAIEAYAKAPVLKHDVKVLKGNRGDFKRLRVGDYRVIFDDDRAVMAIYNIMHRQEAYND